MNKDTLKIKQNSRSGINIKIMATVFYYVMMKILGELLQPKDGINASSGIKVSLTL